MSASEENESKRDQKDNTIKSLEVFASGHRFAIPVPFIAQLVEVELSPPPPLSQDWVSGIAVHDGKTLVSIRAYGPILAKQTVRTVQVAVFNTPGSKVRWSVEFSTSGQMFDATLIDFDQQKDTEVPSWARMAHGRDKNLWWIDVERLLKDLAGVEATRGDVVAHRALRMVSPDAGQEKHGQGT